MCDVTYTIDYTDKESFTDTYICFSKIGKNLLKNSTRITYTFNVIADKKAVEVYIDLLNSFRKLKPLFYGQKENILNGKFTISTEKFNGLQVFTALTLIRAIEESPEIVDNIYTASRTHKNLLLKDKIKTLKYFSCVYTTNDNHCIVTYGFRTRHEQKLIDTNYDWLDTSPANKTGLVRNIHNTFMSVYVRWLAPENVKKWVKQYV